VHKTWATSKPGAPTWAGSTHGGLPRYRATAPPGNCSASRRRCSSYFGSAQHRQASPRQQLAVPVELRSEDGSHCPESASATLNAGRPCRRTVRGLRRSRSQFGTDAQGSNPRIFGEPNREPTATDAQPNRATSSRILAAQRLTKRQSATPGNGQVVTGGQGVAGSNPAVPT
jgi:hypothetical protein